MYISTRSSSSPISASEAIINGLANDNGLYVPENVKAVDKSFEELSKYSYKDMAVYILKYLLDDFDIDELTAAVNKAYDSKFDNDEIAPIKKVGDEFFLELYHGKTLAFKDIALSLFPYLIKSSLQKKDVKEDVLILTATSGDTGKAALEAFKDIAGIKIIVFYPNDGVSSLQKLQMITQEGVNTYVVALEGNFDNAQKGVKSLFNNINFISKLTSNNYRVSSANSINIGRLLPQIVYYFYSYCTLLKNKEILHSEKVNFVVPTGNFGNILAGFYAYKMGLPINKLICASNENNILSDFINTGVYDVHRRFITTSSPSMDILISSNLERLLFELSGHDSDIVRNLMKDLDKKGIYRIPQYLFIELNKYFYGGYADEKEVSYEINSIYKKNGYLIDPHTAVGYSVYSKYKNISKDESKTVILSTANPYKFPETIDKSLETNIRYSSPIELVKKLSKKTGIPIPNQIADLNDKPVIHFNSCKVNDMQEIIYKLLKGGSF